MAATIVVAAFSTAVTVAFVEVVDCFAPVAAAAAAERVKRAPRCRREQGFARSAGAQHWSGS